MLLEVNWVNRLVRLTRQEKQAVYDFVIERVRDYRKKTISTDGDAYYAQLEHSWADAIKYFAENYFEAILPQMQLDLSS